MSAWTLAAGRLNLLGVPDDLHRGLRPDVPHHGDLLHRVWGLPCGVHGLLRGGGAGLSAGAAHAIWPRRDHRRQQADLI